MGGAVLTRFCHRGPWGLRGRALPGPGLLAALAGPGTGACPGAILIGNLIRKARTRGCINIWCTRARVRIRPILARAIAHARGLLVDAHAGGGWCAGVLQARAHRPWQAGGAGAGSAIPGPRPPAAETKSGPLGCWPCTRAVGWRRQQVAGLNRAPGAPSRALTSIAHAHIHTYICAYISAHAYIYAHAHFPYYLTGACYL